MHTNKTIGKAAIRRIVWLLDNSSNIDQRLIIQTLDAFGDILSPSGVVVSPIRIVDGKKQRGGFLRRLFGFKAEEPDRSPPPYFEPPAHGFYKILPERVFNWESVSPQSLSHYLSCYTQLIHADLLIAQEGTKWKICETFRRSFPASLGAESKIPVLLLSDENALKGKNGVTGAKNHFKNILFPIVDPKIGATGFKNLLEFAKLSDSKVTLLYVNRLQLENGFGISTGDQFGSIPFYEPTTLFEEKARLQVVADWVKLAEARGVRTEVKLDTVSLSLVESVLKFQKDVGCDLIAFDSSYFDSYAFKHAIKNSDILECPIWISGPGGQSASKDRLRFLEERLKSAVS